MKNKILLILALFLLFTTPSLATTGITKNNAQMQAMDKITGRVSVINIPVGGMVNFGSLSIVVRSCKTRPVEETPDNFVFTYITDKNLKGEEFSVFKGWMISSSPATHALEHPIYDVWLLKCTDEEIDKRLMLTEEQLSRYDNLPLLNDSHQKDDASGNNIVVDKGTELVKTISEIESNNQNHSENSATLSETEFFYDEEEREEELSQPENQTSEN